MTYIYNDRYYENNNGISTNIVGRFSEKGAASVRNCSANKCYTPVLAAGHELAQTRFESGLQQ